MPDGQTTPAGPAFELDPVPQIAFEKFVLPNGLRLLVHEDRKIPVVSVNTWFGVGAKDEPPGRTGFAHLFEHLLFKGSREWPGSWHNTLEGLGAQGVNGTTNYDRTNFFQTVPVGALDMVLALENNRVETLLDSIDKPTLDAEINVVLNEKQQREGEPGGRILEVMAESFYPVGHPYAHTVLGSAADVSAADLKSVEEWHGQYYGAANSVVVLAGDVSGEEARDLVERRMGGRFAGSPTRHVADWIPPHMPNRVVLGDHITTPTLRLVWRGPGLRSDESLMLHLFGQMLAVGPRAPLFKAFVEPGLAFNVGPAMEARYLSGEFSIGLNLQPGVDPARAEALVLETLRNALDGGLDAATLARRVRSNRHGDLRTLESLETRATHLAHGELLAGDAAYITRRMGRSLGLDIEAVLGAARKWLDRPPFVLRLEPFVARTQVATPAPAPVVRPRPAAARFPQVDRFALENGIKVEIVHRPGAPTVESAVLIPGRLGRETMETAGLTGLTLGLLDAGMRGRDREEIAELFEDLGVKYRVGAGEYTGCLSLSIPRGELATQLQLLHDVLVTPTFPEAEFERTRTAMVGRAQAAAAAPMSPARRLLVRKAYGPRHLAAVPGGGLPASLASFTLDDVRHVHRDLLDPSRLSLLLVGDLAGADVPDLVRKAWGGLAAPAQAAAPVSPDPILAEPGVYAARGKLGAQALLMGLAARPRPGPSAAEAAVVNHIVGGAFSSRLNAVLREEHGWTYGINSQIGFARDRFEFSVSSQIQGDRVVDALEIARSILARTALTPDISQAELDAARDAIALRLAARWSTNASVLSAMVERIEHDRSPDDIRFADDLESLTLERVHAAANAAADPNAMTWVIGFDPDGPAAEAVEAAGIPVVDEP